MQESEGTIQVEKWLSGQQQEKAGEVRR